MEEAVAHAIEKPSAQLCCMNCGHRWQPKVEKPKACPRCRRRWNRVSDEEKPSVIQKQIKVSEKTYERLLRRAFASKKPASISTVIARLIKKGAVSNVSYYTRNATVPIWLPEKVKKQLKELCKAHAYTYDKMLWELM